MIGEVAGALVFGHLTDRLGRKKLFLVTLALYLVATALSGAAPWYALFVPLRFFAGAGIGGEYSAINSAIDELVPARIRGRIDLAINGSYWIGVGFGAVLTVAFLHASFLPEQHRVARDVRARRGARRRDPARPPPRAGEPALAADARLRRRRRRAPCAAIEDEIRASGIAVAEGIAPVRDHACRARSSLRYLAHMLLRVLPAPHRARRRR